MALDINDITITKEMEDILASIDRKENLFITGKAGSGKTTLLRYIQQKYENECVTVAPTGVAAINAGGVTIHNMFSLSIGILNPNEKFEWRLPADKKAVLKYANILIIDEISMVRCDLMDAIDRRLRSARKCKQPFGGIQVLMFGDMMQLPPVVTGDEANALSEIYDDFYFFNANVFNKTSFEVKELTEIFRQRDEKFISLLNNVREGELEINCKEDIKSMLDRTITDDDAVHLCALRSVAESYNRRKLGNPSHIFEATLTGDFNPKNANCDLELKLKVGARVMITKNDTMGEYCNGTLGYVYGIKDNIIEVVTDEGKKVAVVPNKWEAYKYTVETDLNEKGELDTKIMKYSAGTCTQFPLTLAYAITIHKSQGLTFDKVVLHIKEIFQTGQLYTALSRCRNMENVSIDSDITNDMLSKNLAINNFLNIVKKNNNKYGNFKKSK